MTYTEIIHAHRRDQQRRGLLPSTIDARSRIVRNFALWLGDGADVLTVTVEDVENFLDARRLGRKARYAYISNLHVFYAWALHAGRATTDPTLDIIRPRLRAGFPRPISDVDLDQAITMADPTLRVILVLAAYQGFRCCEVGRLVRQDILDDRDEPVIIARGKGDRPRAVPLHFEVAAALEQLPLPKTGPVLRRDDGRAMPSWHVSHLGNTYLHGIGIESTMHQLRHWFGTTLYATSGKDLLMVKDLMGHASMTTTTVYAAFNRADAPAAVKALNAHRHLPLRSA